MDAPGPSSRGTIGPYRIVARVGAGGMGEVFKAWDPRLERDVAIKLLHPDATGDPDRQRRLLAEGRAASALNTGKGKRRETRSIGSSMKLPVSAFCLLPSFQAVSVDAAVSADR